MRWFEAVFSVQFVPPPGSAWRCRSGSLNILHLAACTRRPVAPDSVCVVLLRGLFVQLLMFDFWCIQHSHPLCCSLKGDVLYVLFFFFFFFYQQHAPKPAIALFIFSRNHWSLLCRQVLELFQHAQILQMNAQYFKSAFLMFAHCDYGIKANWLFDAIGH